MRSKSFEFYLLIEEVLVFEERLILRKGLTPFFQNLESAVIKHGFQAVEHHIVVLTSIYRPEN